MVPEVSAYDLLPLCHGQYFLLQGTLGWGGGSRIVFQFL